MINLHRRQLAGLVEIRGVGRLRPLYDQSRVELERKLKRLLRAGKGQTFQAHHLRQVLVQVRTAIRDVEGDVAANLEEVGEAASELAPRHLVHAIEVLGSHFAGTTPVLQPRQAAVFQRAYADSAPSLLDHFRQSSRLYGPPVVKKIRDQLTLSMLQGEGIEETIDRVAGTDGAFANQRWRAERIVRTESAFSYGVAKQVGMQELRREVPKLQKRLVATNDDREGDDSKELNGQTVDVDKPFVWVVKDSRGRPTGKVVRYMQPPNRPNDREIVIPWQSSWPASPALDNAGPVDPSTAGVPVP